MTALAPLRGLVIIDEVQHQPGLFPVLRVLADRARTPARFLLLGSASPDLVRHGSESLAGRDRLAAPLPPIAPLNRAVSSLTWPFGPPSPSGPSGRGKVGAASGRRFMGRDRMTAQYRSQNKG
jgi:hypothetical protein